ncbi:YraN family protein [Phreatobacter sp.]|uniref:YraN family protein n=1 Tax=Phreatobacter sp. TaxID=1966341 RepID=UPI003F700B32
MARRQAARREADPKRSAAWGRGRLAELAAAALLLLKGYRILARRWRAPGAEIDLIARRGATLVFVEVKARAASADADLALTRAQRLRIARAAEFWCARHPRHAAGDRRYDLVLVSRGGWPRHIEGAFDADS